MRTFLTPLALATTLLVGAAAPAWADFWDGIAAYEAGDYATALKEFRPLAAQGHVLSQNNLGAMYFDGRGVPQDDAEAVKWYRLAAAQGYALAQANLGIMYGTGQGVPQDYAAAVKWYRLAAAQGHAVGQINLGAMYDTGLGVPQDYAEAVKLYRLAAEQGYADAQYNLGAMYFDGRGVPQDDAEAVKWYRLAAAQGIEKPPFFARILLFKKPFAIAQHNLALMYHAGRGVPQDYAEAKRSSAGPPCTSISQVPMRSVLFMPFLDPQLTAYEDEPDFC
jgi:hypothetical protein